MQTSVDLSTIDYVIAPQSYHAWYLKQKKGRWHFQFQLITQEQFLADVTFTFDLERALTTIVSNMNLEPGVALILLKALRFLDVSLLGRIPQGAQLNEVYQQLLNANIIQRNPLATAKYNSKRCLVDGYHVEDPQMNRWFKQLAMNVQFKPIGKPKTNTDVHIFESVEDEVSYFFNQVSVLISQGVSLQHMVLIEPDAAYQYELERQSHYYQIPIQFNSSTKLYALPLTQELLRLIKLNMSWSAIWESLSSIDLEQTSLLKKTLAPFQLDKLSIEKQLACVEHVSQQTRLREPLYRQAIQVVSEVVASDDMHVYILGFLQGSFPSTYRDKRFFDDESLHHLGLMSSKQQQEMRTHRLLQIFAGTNHLYVSYPLLINGKPSIASPLIQQLGLTSRASSFLIGQTDYSGKLGMIRKGKYTYQFKQFHDRHPYLSAYQQQFPNEIALFAHPFTPIETNPNQVLKLSYSALKDYYQCSFKYFVGRILKVKPMDQDEFYMHLGTFAHEVFETLGDELHRFDEVFDNALNNQKNLSAKEMMLFAHLKPKLFSVCEFNALHRAHMAYQRTDVEKEMIYQHDANTTLQGFIDKIMVVKQPDGHEYVAVIDYKSGAEIFDEQLIPYGWSLQLPIYALMLKHHADYQDQSVLGLFIQHIVETSLSPKVVEMDGKSFSKSYQLDGVVLSDVQGITLLDDTIRSGKSVFLEGVSLVKKGGFRSTNHVKTQSQFDGYVQVAKDKITQAADGIRQGRFAINPKKIKGKSSCDYCPFLDTCFRQSSDVAIITMPKKEEVTDGDTD
jgi:ATP-dependent helicase/DNAse subunit B